MKKVLYIGMTEIHGGTETFVMNLIENLDRTKFKPCVLDSTKNGLADMQWLLEHDVEVIKFDYPYGAKAIFERSFRAKRFFQKHKFDVVHIQANNLNVAFWAIDATKILKCRVIVHAHNTKIAKMSPLKNLVFKMLMPIQKTRLKRVRNLIRLSASEKAGEWLFGNRRFDVIPNGVDAQKYSFDSQDREKQRELLNVGSKNLMLSIARFNYQKNQERILEILKFAEEKNPQEWEAIFVGEGDTLDEMESYAKDNNLPARFMSPTTDVKKYYDLADILVMPSRYEAFPYTLVEAQANGLPSIVSEEAVPKDANITGSLTYVSLEADDATWVDEMYKILSEPRENKNLIEGTKYDSAISAELIEAYY